MEYRRYYLMICRPQFRPGLLTLAEIAQQTGVHPELVERMVEMGLIEPEQCQPEMLFSPATVAYVSRALRLRNQLGINWNGVGVVMDLLERISQLEDELRRLRND